MFPSITASALSRDSIAAFGVLASGRTLPALEQILASHPMVHTAEGEFFRKAIREACREIGI